MVKMPHFETSCLETGIKILVTETGQQLPPSIKIFISYSSTQQQMLMEIEGNVVSP